MSVEDVLDGTTSPDPKPPITLPTGTPSKHDPKGIMDENLQIRQNIVRKIATLEGVETDPELMTILLKTMADQDKSVISQARIKVEEESNANQQELIKHMVREAIILGDSIRRHSEDVIDVTAEDVSNIKAPELPPPSREILDSELDIGTVVLSEKEIMEALNTLPAGGPASEIGKD